MTRPDRPPRVLYSFPDQLGGPGINHTAWQQVNGLAELDIDLTVFCSSVRDPVPPAVHVVETMRLAGHRVPHRGVGISRALAYHDWRVARALAQDPERWDLVHVWPSAVLRTAAAARRAGVVSFRELPNAHTAQTFEDSARACREVGVELPRGASHRHDRRRLEVEEREFVAVDYLLAPSQYVRDSFLQRGTGEGRVLRHRYGFDPGRFPAPEENCGSDRVFTAAFVGRGEPPKGLHLGLDAWRRSGVRGHFLILGNVLDDYAAVMADQLGAPDVERVGFVADVGAVLRECDVLLLPTYTEGSALVVYEAIASGVVPLVSDAAGAPAQHEDAVLVHGVGDVATLAAQIADLDGDASHLARLRSRCLDLRDELTWLCAARLLVDCYVQGVDAIEGRGERSVS